MGREIGGVFFLRKGPFHSLHFAFLNFFFPQKSYLYLVTNHLAAMKTEHPELYQPEKVSPGSDRIRNQSSQRG